ncbi:MAG: hypothetical protein ABSA49_16755, partial [Rhizomicrobium sp.]
MFDRPAEKVVIQFLPARKDAGSPVTISCFYYPKFMVKVIKGDPSPNREYASAIVPGSKPSCEKTNRTEDYAGWGPFTGVRDGFVFFDSGSPGDHGDRGFVIT